MTLRLASDSREREGDLPCAEPASGAKHCIDEGRAAYRLLTGRDAGEAAIGSGRDFDLHVLASIIAIAASEGGALATSVGLAADDLDALAARWFPHARVHLAAKAGTFVEDEEAILLRDLLLSRSTDKSDDSRWLAHMVARRALEPNHLWEDLGLRERSELTRLLERHFAPLARRNTRNMRWKRFFYRMLCEDDGFLMCATPVCTDCRDFEDCFAEEDGEGRLAPRRRAE